MRSMRNPMPRAPALLFVAAWTVACCGKPRKASPLSIRVAGNHFVDGGGNQIRLLGVNLSGQTMCTGTDSLLGPGIFDGPSDDQSIAVMKQWRINAVRIQLNESCWLGINGSAATTSGPNYRNAMVDYVNRLHAQGIYVMLDLNYNAPGNRLAVTAQIGPDADHAPDFWQSVAAAFQNDPAVLFDLYNEPIHDRFIQAGADKWACWRDGCNTTVYYDGTVGPSPDYNPLYIPLTWPMAGTQALVDRIRGAGAHQPVVIGGLDLANDLGDPSYGWLTSLPNDPDNQIVAAVHVYGWSNLKTVADWDRSYAPVAALHPLVTAELGEADNRQHAFIDVYMAWADSRGASYLGWAWQVYHPDPTQPVITAPTLITDYGDPQHPLVPNGKPPTPTVMGTAFRDHLAQIVH